MSTPNSQTPETSNAGAIEAYTPEIRPGMPAFIGPDQRRSFWNFINPLQSELAAMRKQLPAVVVSEDDWEALAAAREEKVDGRLISSKFIRAKERAGGWLAVNLSARGISTGTLQALETLGSVIEVAGKIARGEAIDGKKPTIEDQVKAAAAVAVGVKTYGETSTKVIEQLQPIVADKKPENNRRGPSIGAPIVSIQAQQVTMVEPAKSGNGEDATDV